ncbi:DUF3598 domain-containing protein [Nonomuraea turkmeniaca]|uniref:DUF3598 domain-containing protein n=1 Tax=Nonomuraea turkmeniaca TaxID=103838 RepID=A0A5S4F9A6_9ACTN|nr:DUF3598 domain-containing protein [Nonomuraea turkmeniaca]TMR13430.1 DUF3598 domain-containing protein [Nonomuraea turkmeniaca]
MGLRAGMPLLARHEGEWEGEYLHLGRDGTLLDRHRVRMTCRIVGDDAYHQVNRYTWDDGRTEVHEFPGAYLGGGRCGFDTDRLKGVFWEVDDSTIYLTWEYKGQPLRLFEMIVLSADGKSRSRVWQWLEDGVCVRRTLIDERRVA